MLTTDCKIKGNQVSIFQVSVVCITFKYFTKNETIASHFHHFTSLAILKSHANHTLQQDCYIKDCL